MSIAAAYRPGMRGKRVDTRKPRYQVGERRSCSPYGHGAERLGELSHARCGRPILVVPADFGYQLLILDSPIAHGPRIRSFSTLCAYVQRYS